MVTVTALNNLRCSLRPELIVSVVAGAPTTVILANGVSLAVCESADEVQRRIDRARAAAEPAAVRGSHAVGR
jgi:uncharacterized protein YlzI (FlbEa/FlbD family)